MTLAISYILISVLGGAIGQLMLKNGMNKFGVVTLSLDEVPQLLMKLALNPWVVGGLFLYACGTIFWLAGISRVDMSTNARVAACTGSSIFPKPVGTMPSRPGSGNRPPKTRACSTSA